MSSVLPLAGAAAAPELLIRATLLIGGAWAAAAALRAGGASAAARHMAWLLGIAALLALPLVWWLAPALLLPVLPAEAATAAASAPPSAAAAPVLAASGSPLPGQWIFVLLLAWALGALILLLRIAVARRVLARLWRDARPASDPAWQDLLSALSREMRLPRPVELRIAEGSVMPMTWGTLEPRLLLPAEALAWPPERRRLVLLHELAHVARRDSLSRSAASLACALYWFHPGAWFAARRMQMEQEHAADDRVLTAGGSARAYARNLLHLAAPADERLRPAHAASMAGMAELERRLVSITSPARRDRPSPVFLSSSALLASLATLVVAAGVPIGATPALPDSPRAGADGIASTAVAQGPRAKERPPVEAGAGREAEPGPAEEAGRRQGSVDARTASESPRPSRQRGAGVQAGQPARRDGPAASGDGVSRNSGAPMIPLRSESFTLSPAASTPAFRVGEPPRLHLASNGPPVPSAVTQAVPRSFPASEPKRSRRAQSPQRPRFVLAVRGVPVDL